MTTSVKWPEVLESWLEVTNTFWEKFLSIRNYLLWNEVFKKIIS